MTTVGLQEVDFDKIRFITISADGKNIMESGKVSKEEHLRIKIQPDLGMKYIPKAEAEKLKEYAEATTVDNGKCPACKDSESSCKDMEGMKCNDCGAKAGELWVCRVNPTRHSYCDECYQAQLKQVKYEEENH